MVSSGVVLGLMHHLRPTRATDITERQKCIGLAMDYGRSPDPQIQPSTEKLYAHTLTFADTIYLVERANMHVTVCVVALVLAMSLFLILAYKCFQIYNSNAEDIFRTNYPIATAIVSVFVIGVAYLLARAKLRANTPTPVFIPTNDTTIAATSYPSAPLSSQQQMQQLQMQPSQVQQP